MRQRVAALAIATLAIAGGVLAWTSPAVADTPGFDTQVSQAPETFTVGNSAKSLSAVVSTDRSKRCRAVRWSLAIRTDGISLDQIRVDRIENGQSEPLRTQLGADEAQVTDTQLDAGQVCRGRTDTARWDIGFTGPDDGKVTFEARAFDGANQLLSTASVSSRVVSPVAAKPTPTETEAEAETPAASASPTPSFSAEATEAATVEPTEVAKTPDLAAVSKKTGGPSVLGPGLVVGAVLVFLGVGLLLRLRSRNRKKPGGPEDLLPTGFYNLPSRPDR